MTIPSSPHDAEAEVTIQDPVDGQMHTFIGATEAEALSEAERYFGVDEAQEREL